ncbi:hypothetical protein MPTK1_5g08710 [Marchantia polymorpha subsp. ruderalis]|uniref:Uncharacterized protein n=2 Tax=Marchantia polymorpha TaxID=3197 RepID=A0AAF6BGC8_MARPO|nr:hypothetical protein MARPO_0086s0075 [Marchantia polymorpha]BBN11062.1 hypothetical protein Mp_5g08710 [Marchantia polymorpha subsp. ruderalis]|eukprot:PTQ33760.1 hypothetical protein MARPO_0086s0075 [Marchantia polymorpha]
MNRASLSPLRGRNNTMEVLMITEFVKFVKRKALFCWESAVGAKWRAHTWTVSFSKRLHPWLRIPVVLATDSLAWILLMEVGISLVFISLATVYFNGMFVLAPYLAVLFWLLSYFAPPLWNLSHPPPDITFLLALCSVCMFCILSFIQSRIKHKDPSLDVGDFVTSFLLRIPAFQQLVVGYSIFSLGSACAAVFTLDLFLAVYWGFFGTFYVLEVCYLLLCRLPWFVFIPAGVALPLLSVGLLRKLKSHRSRVMDSERQMIQQSSFRSPV